MSTHCLCLGKEVGRGAMKPWWGCEKRDLESAVAGEGRLTSEFWRREDAGRKTNLILIVIRDGPVAFQPKLD